MLMKKLESFVVSINAILLTIHCDELINNLKKKKKVDNS